ncbi:hypothetical protein CYMTET_24079 [Cymbomonas tetramitiformis]|uniref:Nucleotide-diphospho-sugar transferase domain-containing protein n=1 Tax=Cymbomonas tetramitiformis TaxID=36881 RepID=A0AAE0L0L9_9CHLO|nr:hypothetical protein CYMTET_24079 [Cymbomonas tetramitiformis]
MQTIRVFFIAVVCFGIGALLGLGFSPSLHATASAPSAYQRSLSEFRRPVRRQAHEELKATAVSAGAAAEAVKQPARIAWVPRTQPVTANSVARPRQSEVTSGAGGNKATAGKVGEAAQVEYAHQLELLRSKLEKAIGNNDKKVAITFANVGYKDFFDNWIAHVRKLGWNNFVVGAIDDGLYEHCIKEGIPVLPMNSTSALAEALGVTMHNQVAGASLSTEDFRANSHKFHKMGGEKAALVSGLLDLGMEVLLSDSDTIWLRDPWAYLQVGAHLIGICKCC